MWPALTLKKSLRATYLEFHPLWPYNVRCKISVPVIWKHHYVKPTRASFEQINGLMGGWCTQTGAEHCPHIRAHTSISSGLLAFYSRTLMEIRMQAFLDTYSTVQYRTYSKGHVLPCRHTLIWYIYTRMEGRRLMRRIDMWSDKIILMKSRSI